MSEYWRIFLQVIFYLVFAMLLKIFAQDIDYRHMDPANALIKLSFSHAGQHREECRRLSQEELEKLAPNMRMPVSCNRERLPLLVEITLDGEVIYRDSLPPAGLAKDGESSVYKRFSVSPGTHTVTARLRDSHRNEGFDYEQTGTVTLSPQQNFVIDFNAGTGGFIFL